MDSDFFIYRQYYDPIRSDVNKVIFCSMRIKSKFLLPTLLATGIVLLNILDFIPGYTKLALVFLILPSIFFVMRKEEQFDEKKYAVTLLFAVIATIVWDSVAIRAWLWRFPTEAVSFWILGIPLEEYVFGLWLPTIVLGIYTSLPKWKQELKPRIEPRLAELPLFGILFIIQLIVFSALLSDPDSYIKWLLFFATIPSFFFMWRKGEKIDERRLLATIGIMVLVAVVIDLIFIPARAWLYNEHTLLFRIGLIPFDDILFGIFNAILVIGFYTSLPSQIKLNAKL
ncbi:MAG: lycopene cyclase domain-containing protein [Candidatus Omnitrophota bacterium]|nr:lycopene cyclase domain-containing protein [Candidatus Omnitrophota bacterium]